MPRPEGISGCRGAQRAVYVPMETPLCCCSCSQSRQSAWREPAAADSSLLPSAAPRGCPGAPTQEPQPPARSAPGLLARLGVLGTLPAPPPLPTPAPDGARSCTHEQQPRCGAELSLPTRGGRSVETAPLHFHSPGGSFHPGSSRWNPKQLLTFERKVSNKAALLWQWQPQAPPPVPWLGTRPSGGSSSPVLAVPRAMSCSPRLAPRWDQWLPLASAVCTIPRVSSGCQLKDRPRLAPSPCSALSCSPPAAPAQAHAALAPARAGAARRLLLLQALLGTSMARHGRSPWVRRAAGCRLPWVCLPSTVQSPRMTWQSSVGRCQTPALEHPLASRQPWPRPRRRSRQRQHHTRGWGQSSWTRDLHPWG